MLNGMEDGCFTIAISLCTGMDKHGIGMNNVVDVDL